jgi:hypothetical protein
MAPGRCPKRLSAPVQKFALAASLFLPTQKIGPGKGRADAWIASCAYLTRLLFITDFPDDRLHDALRRTAPGHTKRPMRFGSFPTMRAYRSRFAAASHRALAPLPGAPSGAVGAVADPHAAAGPTVISGVGTDDAAQPVQRRLPYRSRVALPWRDPRPAWRRHRRHGRQIRGHGAPVPTAPDLSILLAATSTAGPHSLRLPATPQCPVAMADAAIVTSGTPQAVGAPAIRGITRADADRGGGGRSALFFNLAVITVSFPPIPAGGLGKAGSGR